MIDLTLLELNDKTIGVSILPVQIICVCGEKLELSATQINRNFSSLEPAPFSVVGEIVTTFPICSEGSIDFENTCLKCGAKVSISAQLEIKQLRKRM